MKEKVKTADIMSKLVRDIKVDGKVYQWILDENSVYGEKEYIRIHVGKSTKSILYLDPYNWHLEIRPKTIREAILFAINHDWNPEVSTRDLFISYNGDGFFVLPNG